MDVENSRGVAELLRRVADRLRETVPEVEHQLRQIVSLAEGTLVPKWVPFDPLDVVERVSRSLAKAAADARVVLIADPSVPSAVIGDPEKLEELLWWLGSAALAAGPSVTLRVGAERSSHGYAAVAYEVVGGTPGGVDTHRLEVMCAGEFARLLGGRLTCSVRGGQVSWRCRLANAVADGYPETRMVRDLAGVTVVVGSKNTSIRQSVSVPLEYCGATVIEVRTGEQLIETVRGSVASVVYADDAILDEVAGAMLPPVAVISFSVPDALPTHAGAFLQSPVRVARVYETCRRLAADVIESVAEGELGADVRPLIPGYLRNRREELSRLKAMIDSSDYCSIATVGHQIAGTGGAYGFSQLGLIGQSLESAANEKATERVTEVSARLAIEVERLYRKHGLSS